ncbi:hypothetical protein FXO37_06666 [Capsicum annuum]|nr:hypothetical protein FXO37_06666 [Capsicum annuum]
MEKVWGENNDEDAEKFTILYFLHFFVLSNAETVVIPRLHFNLVDSERYKDFPWGTLSFEDLARSLNNRLKAGGKFYLIQGMPLAIQVWLYECCSNVPPKIASKVDNQILRLLNWKTNAPQSRFEFLMNAMFNDDNKVVFKNIEPTQIELAKFQIPQKDVIEDERSVDSDDDFQDLPPKQINEHSKKKQKVDSSTLAVKKPSRKKLVNIVDEHTQKRTPTPRAAKAAGMKTPVFKPIQTRQATSSKMKKVRQEFKGIRRLVKKKFNRMLKAFEQRKQQYEDKDPELQHMNYVGAETSPQYFSLNVDQNLGENQDGTKISDEKMDETNLSDSQFTIPDELLPTLNAYRRESITTHPSATFEEEPIDEHLNDKNFESVVEDHFWPDSQNTILDELLYSLNIYSSKSIIVHPYANRELQAPIQKLRIRRSSKFKESPYTMKFGSAAGSSAGYTRIFLQKHPFVYHSIDEIVDTKIVKKFMDWISVDLLKVHAKRSIHDVYTVDDPNLTTGGQETHLNEYINEFCLHVVVPWRTVKDIYIPVNIKEKHHWVLIVLSFSERCIFLYDSYESSGHYPIVLAKIEKLAEIIPLCLQACDFYNKKGIDLQNHPRYKDKDYSDMFDVLFEENLPQQPSGNL